MKFNLSLTLGLFMFVIGTVSGQAESDYFYYHKGKKIFLELNTEFCFLALKSNKIPKVIKNKTIEVSERNLSHLKKNQKLYWVKLKMPSGISKSAYLRKLATLKTNPEIEQASPYFKRSDVSLIGQTNLFNVKLKDKDDEAQLKTLAKHHNIAILGQNQTMPQWYTLHCKEDASIDALTASNLFTESGLFEAAEPELQIKLNYDDIPASEDKLYSNDTYFNNQWGLKNTGQFTGSVIGLDVKAESAWTITKGANVRLAICDRGVEPTHPDLQANLVESYDMRSATRTSVLYNGGQHGTACAGILAAVQDNNEGISGIAPESDLISISLPIITTVGEVAQIFYTAVDSLDADVLSNSWNIGTMAFQIIDDAISYVLQNGRDNKGLIIVFSSGNNANSMANYPATSNSDILVVGAMHYDGLKPTFSNTGPNIDLVAPGQAISSTDITSGGFNVPGQFDYPDRNYTIAFAGTSAACPFVAGTAALVLSANPNLTGFEVREAIESSVQKVSPSTYTYTSTPDRANGTWNDQVGYGMLDAHAAVQSAQQYGVLDILGTSGPEYGTTDALYYFGALVPSRTIRPVSFTFQATDHPDIILNGQENFRHVPYSWSSPGVKTISITASNAFGTVTESRTITIADLAVCNTSIVTNCATPGVGVKLTICGTSASSNYEVQYSYNLQTWLVAETAIPGQDMSFEWTDCGGFGRDPNAASAFYRVVISDDRDGDGLGDGFERFILNTDETLQDSDGDGIKDSEEDPDGDGLTNLEEFNSPLNSNYNSCFKSNGAAGIADLDGDMRNDSDDLFPADPAAWLDNDCDGKADQPLQTASTSRPPIQVDDELTLSLTTSGSGSIEATAATWQGPQTTSCQTSCNTDYYDNTLISLKAIPECGYIFTGWSDPTCGNSSTCEITLDQAKTITANFAPFSIGPDQSFCNQIVINPGDEFSSYLWSDGSVSQTLTTSMSGTYALEVTYPDGCTSSDTIVLTQTSIDLDLSDTTICVGSTLILDAGPDFDTYFWSNSTNAQAIHINPTQPGVYEYTVFVENDNGCTTNSTVEVTVEACLGVNGNYIELPVSFFPNPAKDQLQLSISKDQQLQMVSIFDNQGQMLLNESLDSNSTNLDISKLPNGIYVITFEGDEIFQTSKLVVLK